MSAVILATAACDTPTSAPADLPPYDPTSLVGGTIYRWTPGSVVKVWVSPDNRDDRALETSTDRAVQRWNDVPQFAEVRLVRTGIMKDANIVIYDRLTANPLSPEVCSYEPRGTGTTWFCISNNRALRIRSADGSETNVTVLIATNRGAVADQALYDAVVVHEFGHALGIGGHSMETTDVMYGNPMVSTPSNRDRQTLWYVFRQPPTTTLN